MTKAEAIEILKKDRDLCLFNPITGEKEPMSEDCRQSAEAYALAIEALEQPERKKGTWIKRAPSLFRCSECPRFSPTRENFCPKCGAEMENPDER